MEWRSGSPKGPRSKQSSLGRPAGDLPGGRARRAVVTSTGAWSTTHPLSPGPCPTVPADVDVVVLEQSSVEEILSQDFLHTEELLERGYFDARVVLDRVGEADS